MLKCTSFNRQVTRPPSNKKWLLCATHVCVTYIRPSSLVIRAVQGMLTRTDSNRIFKRHRKRQFVLKCFNAESNREKMFMM